MPDSRNPRPSPGVPKSKAWRPGDTREGTAQGRPNDDAPVGINDREGLEEGRRRRKRRVKVVRVATTADAWRHLIDRAIDELATKGTSFTAEDVREVAGEPPGTSANTLGPAINAASRARIIEQVGYELATRPEAHSRVLRVWKGVGR